MPNSKGQPTVYVSSTFLDLESHRAALKSALEKARYDVACMEKYAAFDERPLDRCLADVAATDVYVLLIANRYGHRPAEDNPQRRSITHLEYEQASRHQKPRLVFTVDRHHPWQPSWIDRNADAADLAAFRAEVEKNHGVNRFSTPDQLASLVLQALQALRPPSIEAASPRPRTYTHADLQRWVVRHQARLSEAFQGLPSVQARQVHVPLDVCLTPAGASATEGPRLLRPEDLEPLLAAAGSHVLLLSGDGGAGKTSLAFAIARWWLEGEPGGVVRLPVLIETALGVQESVADRVRSWLRNQLAAAAEEELAPELIDALLAAKRLIPIVDHLSELTPAAREQLLAALPAGLMVVTSRSDDDGFRERPLSRIVPQRLGLNRLPDFFLTYLNCTNKRGVLTEDDLMPAQAQLKRIVGDKPITVLLAQMFIDDVIANREQGLLAGSVPELMLRYVRLLDTPADPALRRRAGLVISEALVQRALRVVALASHRQGPGGQPLFQPLEFSDALARNSLMAEEPLGLGLSREQAEALLGYLIELRLLLQPGAAVGRLRFPLDPLADHLAAAEQFERLEEQALSDGSGVWEAFLAALEPRPEAERERMRGFLLALRDGAVEAQGKRALAMPPEVPDRLAALGFLDPEGERYRLAQRTAIERKWSLMAQDSADRDNEKLVAKSNLSFCGQPAVSTAKEYNSAQAKGITNLESENSHAGDIYDVFLCHNSTDKNKTKELGRQLIAKGLKPWLDEWNLRPGFSWQRALEEQIANIRSAVIIIGSNGIGPWQNAELEAFLREFVRRKCPVIPVILETCQQDPRLPVFLNGMTWVDFRKRSPDPLVQLIWGITGRRVDLVMEIDSAQQLRVLKETQRGPLVQADLAPKGLEHQKRLEQGLHDLSRRECLAWPPENEPDASPFPGLGCFERKLAPLFFGRDLALQQAQAKVIALTKSDSGLLLIFGPSGCGKSSLLRAGLVPWLAGAEPGRWIVLDPFLPGRKPFRSLETALEKAFRAVGQTPSGESARTGEEILEQLEELRAHTGQQDARVVIAIDQFEELLGRSDEREDAKTTEADDFLSVLAELLKLEGSRVLILATLRSGYLESMQLHHSRILSLACCFLLLGPMDADGLREVIEGPAQRVGLRMEPGLSDRLVRDTPSGDALPLLAFTLRELWDRRADGASLTLKQYEAIGGLAGAVRCKADEVLSTSGATKEEIKALEKAFIDHLVRLTSDGQAAKQPARLVALPAPSRRLVGLFVEARLLVSGKGSDGDAVEIAHEALLRIWPTLVYWIEIGREALLERRRVRRLGEDLSANAPERQRRQALEQLAALAVSGGNEARAVKQEGAQPLAVLLAAAEAPEADRQDAALVLALIGVEQPLWDCLEDTAAPVALRRRAAESLGLLAKRSGDRVQREAIARELAGALRSDALNMLVEGDEGWVEHDRRLPPLQGASRALQLAASAELPLLGSGPGRHVPMLTLTALQEGEALRIRTEVVTPAVWKLPLPGGEQLELVVVEGVQAEIGSPEGEEGRDDYPQFRQKCEGVNVEVQRTVNLKAFALVRNPLSQAQWRAVAALPSLERDISQAPGTYEAKGLWESYSQPGGLAVDSVTWNDCQEWLGRLNLWLQEQWPELGGQGEAPQLALPSESRWEAACRAGGSTPFHFGDTLDASWANYDASYTYGPGREGAYRQRPVPMGFFGLVNRWGLAEMHGQLLEWCADQWHRSPIREDLGQRRGWFGGGGRTQELLDGRAVEGPDRGLADVPQEQQMRLLRGGSWFSYPHYARAAFRYGSSPPAYVFTGVGVRPGCFSPPGSLLGS